MFEEAPRTKRIKPSLKSLAVAAVFLAVALYLAAVLVEGLPLAVVSLVVLLAGASVCYSRVRGVVPRLPAPYGKGLVSEVTLRRTQIQGALIIVAGVSLLFVPFIALFFLPGAIVILGILALTGGISFSEFLTFYWISRLERRTNGTILLVTELSENEGKQVLMKSMELQPRSPKD